MKLNEIAGALEAAIEKTTCEVGQWKVDTGQGYVALSWICGADNEGTNGMYGDEPWVKWGGNSILKAAGVPDIDDGGYDAYVDQYGDSVVAQWVQWNEED